MSLCRCPRCGTIYAPNPVLCPMCHVGAEYYAPPTFTIERVNGYVMPHVPYHGPDRRKAKPASWLDVVRLTIALFGLGVLVADHVHLSAADWSWHDAYALCGAVTTAAFSLLIDPRIFSQIRALQSVLDPGDDSEESV